MDRPSGATENRSIEAALCTNEPKTIPVSRACENRLKGDNMTPASETKGQNLDRAHNFNWTMNHGPRAQAITATKGKIRFQGKETVGFVALGYRLKYSKSH
jgi:hypothetical protein